MPRKRTLLIIVSLILVLSAASCTDEVIVKTFPAACIGSKDKPMKATLNIDQDGSDGAVDSVLINDKGEAAFRIGARTQQKRLFHSGHAPAAKRDPNTIYTADLVTISLKVQDPCPLGTKKLTVVLDSLVHKKHFADGYDYVLPLEQFK